MKSKQIFAAAVAALFISGCASIVSDTSRDLNINSKPSNASISIKNLTNGQTITESNTPLSITLNNSDKMFVGNDFEVLIKKPGFKDFKFQVTSRIDGWYVAGNIISFGLIGWLIVDPLTGAMWTLDVEKSDNIQESGNTVVVTLLEDINPSQMSKAKRIK